MLTLPPGFWPVGNNAAVYRCANKLACPGGVLSLPSDGSAVCGVGHEGPLCGSCAAGYANNGCGVCVVCPSAGASVFGIVVVCGCALAAVAVLAAVLVQESSGKSAMASAWLFGKREVLFARLRVSFELLQVAGLLLPLGTYERGWFRSAVASLAGGGVGGGFSVSTWSPWQCVLPADVAVQNWVQYVLLAAMLPAAGLVAACSKRVSAWLWKGECVLVSVCNCCLTCVSAVQAMQVVCRSGFGTACVRRCC